MISSPYFQNAGRITRAAARTLTSKSRGKTPKNEDHQDVKSAAASSTLSTNTKFKIHVKVESDDDPSCGPSTSDTKADITEKSDESKNRKRQLIKVEYENPEPDVKTSKSGCVPQIKQEPKDTVDYTEGENKPSWEPPLWSEQLSNIYEMRKERNAAVDSMGCDRISDENAQPEVN